MNTGEPEDDLRRVLRPTPASAPADIDAVIRAHARQAPDTVLASENQTRTNSRSWLLRSLPVAAVVVLAIGLIPRLQQEPVNRTIEPAPSAPTARQSDDVLITEFLADSAAEPQDGMEADSETTSRAGAVGLTSSNPVQNQLRESLQRNRRTMKAAESAGAKIRDESSLNAIEEISSFAADSASPVQSMTPQQPPALLPESMLGSENEQLPERAQNAYRDILELLREGKEKTAQIAYKRWRETWPDVEPLPNIEGMSKGEINWFEGAARTFEQSR